MEHMKSVNVYELTTDFGDFAPVAYTTTGTSSWNLFLVKESRSYIHLGTLRIQNLDLH